MKKTYREITTTDFFCKTKKFKGRIVALDNYDGYTGVEFYDPLAVYKEKIKINSQFRLHNVDGKIKTHTGFYLSNNEFQTIKSTRKKPTRNKENDLITILDIFSIYNTNNHQRKIKSSIRIVENLNYEFKNIQNRLEFEEKELKKLKAQPVNEDKDNKKILEQLKKHKKIELVDFLESPRCEIERYLVIKTKDLYYKDKHLYPLKNNLLGRYVIIIPQCIDTKDSLIYLKAFNYTKTFSKGAYHHPCIKNDGAICLGPEMKEYLLNEFQKNNIPALVSLIILFLENPNYNNPYLSMERFQFAQDIKTKGNLKSIINSSWHYERPWDEEKYINEYESYIKERREAPIN